MMPKNSSAIAPVDRQKIVVNNRIGNNTRPNAISLIFVIVPQRQSHHPAREAAVIHIPSSSPVEKKSFGRYPPRRMLNSTAPP